jgi:hypothetical protein
MKIIKYQIKFDEKFGVKSVLFRKTLFEYKFYDYFYD